MSAANINAALLSADPWKLRVKWTDLSDLTRAQAVIEWCHEHGIDTGSVTARPLAAAVSKFGEQPTPEQFLSALQLIVAFLGAR